MDWITKADWDRFAATPIDPEAEPRYDPLKGCLLWPDEFVDGLSRDGVELLGDLFVARSLLHRDTPISTWPGGSHALQQRWDTAIAAGLPWPGFARVSLSADQRTLLFAGAERLVLAPG